MSFAGQNLKYLRKQKSWTQDQLATELDIKRSLVGAYEEERAEPRLDVMQAISGMFDISLEDFLFRNLSEGNLSYLQKRRMAKMEEEQKSVVHLVPIKATAGYLAGYGDAGFIDELNTFTLPMLAPGNYRAFEILGDSMLPTPSGSIVVGEKISDVEELKSNNTYIVVSRAEGIVYKRVEKSGKGKKLLTLISDNPAYSPYQVEANEILEIWKAQLVISKPITAPKYDVAQLANVVNNLQTEVANLKKSNAMAK
jgi:transcriptional regulator with XRE-family HTH domain